MARRPQIDVRRLKEQALEFFKKGKFAKSAECWQQIVEADEKDNQSRLRFGDALAKAGQTDSAWEAYRIAAEGFARAGFLPQAVAAAKLALTLKPHDDEVPKLLAEFHAERFGSRLPSAPPVAEPDAGADAVAAAVSAPEVVPPPPAPVAVAPPGRPSISKRPAAQPQPPPMLVMPEPEPEPQPEPEPVREPEPAPVPEPAPQPDYEAISVDMDAEPDPVTVDPQPEPEPAPTPERPPPPKVRATSSRPAVAPPPPAPTPVNPAPPPPPPPRVPTRPVAPVKLPVARPDPRTQAVTRPYTAKAPLAPPVPAQPPRRIELTTVPLHPPVKVPPLQDEEVGNTTIPGDTGLVAFLGEGSEVSEHTVVAKLPFLDALATVPPAPAPSTSTSSAELGEGELLNRVPLFAELSPAAFTSLLEAASMIRLSKGEVAVEQGTGGDSIYAILTGRVRVFRNEPSGKRRELAILEPGAVFGELAWVTGSSRSAWVVAEVDDTTVLEMTRQLLVKLGPGNPSIARGLATIARRRILSNMMAIEPLFAGLKRNERVDLLEQFEAVDLGRGEVALGEGSELDGLFVVTAGEIEVSSDDGVEMIGPGVLLGDHLALSGEQLFSAVATKRSQVLHLSEASTQRLLAHSSVSGKKDALKRAAWERHRGLR